MPSDEPPVSLVPTLELVRHIAGLAGVDLTGIEVRIDIRDEFRGTGLCGMVHPDGIGITLFPDAFESIHQLAATLGHERTHVYQYAVFGPPADTRRAVEFEAAAVAAESAYLQFLDGHA